MMTAGIDATLDRAIRSGLDGLLAALVPRPLGAHRFQFSGEPPKFDRIFGGQLIAQAMVAASATVADKPLHSLHANFVQAGVPGEAVEVLVDPIRDGRSMATRRVSISQHGRTLLIASASFHLNEEQPEPPWATPTTAAEQLPLLQDWVNKAPEDLWPHVRNWTATPPPLEIRMDEQLFFLGGEHATGPRSMRPTRDVGEDPVLHAALLGYVSDYFLLDMAFRAHPCRDASVPGGVSLDHSIWMHRPVRFDRWHVHTIGAPTISGSRALIHGEIRGLKGRLVASTQQEGLIHVRQ